MSDLKKRYSANGTKAVLASRHWKMRTDTPEVIGRSCAWCSKACERIENENGSENETEHHSDDLCCAPFTHYSRYYSDRPKARR
jgi:hypothetical protein